MEIKITSGTGPDDLAITNAKDFVKAVKSGKSLEDAALSVGEPLQVLLRSPELMERLQDLQQYHFKEASIRKAIVIARNMKTVITGDDRDSVAASRVLALDPELGLVAGTPTIEINISEDVAKMEPGNPFEDETK